LSLLGRCACLVAVGQVCMPCRCRWSRGAAAIVTKEGACACRLCVARIPAWESWDSTPPLSEWRRGRCLRWWDQRPCLAPAGGLLCPRLGGGPFSCRVPWPWYPVWGCWSGRQGLMVRSRCVLCLLLFASVCSCLSFVGLVVVGLVVVAAAVVVVVVVVVVCCSYRCWFVFCCCYRSELYFSQLCTPSICDEAVVPYLVPPYSLLCSCFALRKMWTWRACPDRE
jgi:hypothetical protein